MRHLYYALSFLFGASLVVGFNTYSLHGASKSDFKADLTLADLNGKRMHLRDYRGQIVVLNFWATWCSPCTHEIPLLVQAEKDYKSRGVIFIGASLDESKTRSVIPAFLNRYQVTFPIWVGASADDLAKLGMGEAVPATAFLDQDGRIVARVSGEIRDSELKERIEWLLSDHTGAPPDAFVKHLAK